MKGESYQVWGYQPLSPSLSPKEKERCFITLPIYLTTTSSFSFYSTHIKHSLFIYTH